MGGMRVWSGVVMGILVMSVAGGCAAAGAATEGAQEVSKSTELSEQAEPGRGDTYRPLFPAFEAFELTGEGRQVVELPEGLWAGTVTASFTQEGRAGLWATDEHGTPTSTLVNTATPYEGTTAYGLSGLEDTTSLTIQAEGPWTLKISSIQDAPTLTAPASGQGDGVYWNETTGPVDVTFAGDGRFALTAYLEYAIPTALLNFLPLLDVGELVPGSVEARTVSLDYGAELVTVNTLGAWTFAESS